MWEAKVVSKEVRADNKLYVILEFTNGDRVVRKEFGVDEASADWIQSLVNQVITQLEAQETLEAAITVGDTFTKEA